MAYIIFVNPPILSSTGADFGAVMVATCLSAAIETLIMGLWANYPFALTPGMGLNTFFAFSVVLGMNISWQVALTAVDGILFVLLFSVINYVESASELRKDEEQGLPQLKVHQSWERMKNRVYLSCSARTVSVGGFHITHSSCYSGICNLPGPYHGRHFHDSELKIFRF